MALKSMRLPPDGTLLGGPEEVSLRPAFPPGLALHLDDSALKLLGIEALPPVGTVMEMMARVVVDSRSESEREGRVSRHVTLQVTDMELSGGAKKDPAQLIFMEDN